MILLDGTNIPRTWTGATTGEITSAPTGASYGDTHLNKFWVTGIAGDLSKVSYSATGDFDTWTGAGTGAFNVNQNDGDVCKGLKSFNSNEIIIFKERSMWKNIGDTSANFRVISVDKNVGCVSNRSIENFRGGLLIWAARDGLYVYDGSNWLFVPMTSTSTSTTSTSSTSTSTTSSSTSSTSSSTSTTSSSSSSSSTSTTLY